jgi:hypothetical protein
MEVEYRIVLFIYHLLLLKLQIFYNFVQLNHLLFLVSHTDLILVYVCDRKCDWKYVEELWFAMFFDTTYNISKIY